MPDKPLEPLRALLANASNVLQELTLPGPEFRELDAAIDAALGVVVRLETLAEQERGNA